MNCFSNYIYIYLKMKNKTLIFSLLVMTLLTWCWTSYTTEINFDNITRVFKASKSYIQKTIDKQEYPWMIIYEEEKIDTQDSFINSIIIASQDNISLKTKDFANKNLNSLKASIGSIKVQSTKTLAFNCSWEKIIGIVKYFTTTQNKKNNHFTQFFFINKNKGYIISFQSDNEEDNSDFKTSLSKLSCKK